jgi:hypothetical protein
MLARKQMQDIQNMKLQGYTKADIIAYYTSHGMKPPSRPTLQKYYDMDVIPDDPGKNLEKEKVFDVSPFREAIISILESNIQKDYHMSSVYDVLCEKFIENGTYTQLPGNEQTLRNYVHYLEQNGLINREPEHRRTYDHVFDTPPGEQMLIDFGEYTIDKKRSVFFICMLLRYSRYLCVLAQDHKYNSTEACQAIYRSFCRLGGRPKVLVIDQDSVFVASETYGEVVKTRIFEDFCAEQSLKLWTCNKADPESKGPVENSVGYVKKNFFSARKIESIDDVWRSLPGWLDRKNRRIHQATYRVPMVVFEEHEKGSLQPLLPSFYDMSLTSFQEQDIPAQTYLTYRSCKYSVPQKCAFSTVKFKVVSGKIYVYDKDLNFLCTHNISERKGSFNRLPEHAHSRDDDWIDIMERMRTKYNCYDFQHFINGVKKENPRHISRQLRAIEKFLDTENPDKATVADLLKECCETYRYQYSQVVATYNLRKASKEAARRDSVTRPMIQSVEQKSLDTYTKAFNDRVRKAEGII